MKKITDNIYQIEGLKYSNCYLYIYNNNLILIDTGMPGEYKIIEDELKKMNYNIKKY